jgi:ATP-dependent RNA helicase RhlE
MMDFTSLDLSDSITRAITEQGYRIPTPIQARAIPVILAGQDIMAAAQTGTGKTAAFTLSLLERLWQGGESHPHRLRALILTPTRELAAQVGNNVATYGSYLPLRSMVVFGGVKINPQLAKLREGIDLLVATPGRLLDLYQQGAVQFNQLEVLVLDEADRMLDMGFIRDIRKILAMLPKQRQNLLFSATFSTEVRRLAKSLLNKPVEIAVTPANSTAKRVKQWICPVDKKRKSALLVELIHSNQWQQVLVFCRTKHGANRLARYVAEGGYRVAVIHSNKSQAARTRALDEFKSGVVAILVATDIAARGLDIDQLPQVVNFDLPTVPEDYIHRIGRTGRAGMKGQAVSLVCADEFKQLVGIEGLIKRILNRELIAGFEPVHNVPESRLASDTFPAKRPKRTKKVKASPRDKQRPGDNAQGHKSSSKNKKPAMTGKQPVVGSSKKINSRPTNTNPHK